MRFANASTRTHPQHTTHCHTPVVDWTSWLGDVMQTGIADGVATAAVVVVDCPTTAETHSGGTADPALACPIVAEVPRPSALIALGRLRP